MASARQWRTPRRVGQVFRGGGRGICAPQKKMAPKEFQASSPGNCKGPWFWPASVQIPADLEHHPVRKFCGISRHLGGGELVTPSRSAPPCCIVLSFFWADFHLHRFGDRVGRFFKDHLLRLTSVQSLLSAETRNFFNRLFLPFQKGLNGYGSYIYFAFFCTKCCLLSPADQQFRTSRRFPKNPLIASCAAQLLGGGGIMTHHAIPFQKKSN